MAHRRTTGEPNSMPADRNSNPAPPPGPQEMAQWYANGVPGSVSGALSPQPALLPVSRNPTPMSCRVHPAPICLPSWSLRTPTPMSEDSATLLSQEHGCALPGPVAEPVLGFKTGDDLLKVEGVGWGSLGVYPGCNRGGGLVEGDCLGWGSVGMHTECDGSGGMLEDLVAEAMRPRKKLHCDKQALIPVPKATRREGQGAASALAAAGLIPPWKAAEEALLPAVQARTELISAQHQHAVRLLPGRYLDQGSPNEWEPNTTSCVTLGAPGFTLSEEWYHGHRFHSSPRRCPCCRCALSFHEPASRSHGRAPGSGEPSQSSMRAVLRGPATASVATVVPSLPQSCTCARLETGSDRERRESRGEDGPRVAYQPMRGRRRPICKEAEKRGTKDVLSDRRVGQQALLSPRVGAPDDHLLRAVSWQHQGPAVRDMCQAPSAWGTYQGHGVRDRYEAWVNSGGDGAYGRASLHRRGGTRDNSKSSLGVAPDLQRLFAVPDPDQVPLREREAYGHAAGNSTSMRSGAQNPQPPFQRWAMECGRVPGGRGHGLGAPVVHLPGTSLNPGPGLSDLLLLGQAAGQGEGTGSSNGWGRAAAPRFVRSDVTRVGTVAHIQSRRRRRRRRRHIQNRDAEPLMNLGQESSHREHSGERAEICSERDGESSAEREGVRVSKRKRVVEDVIQRAFRMFMVEAVEEENTASAVQPQVDNVEEESVLKGGEREWGGGLEGCRGTTLREESGGAGMEPEWGEDEESDSESPSSPWSGRDEDGSGVSPEESDPPASEQSAGCGLGLGRVEDVEESESGPEEVLVDGLTKKRERMVEDIIQRAFRTFMVEACKEENADSGAQPPREEDKEEYGLVDRGCGWAGSTQE